jgi:hypothetical protein
MNPSLSSVICADELYQRQLQLHKSPAGADAILHNAGTALIWLQPLWLQPLLLATAASISGCEAMLAVSLHAGRHANRKHTHRLHTLLLSAQLKAAPNIALLLAKEQRLRLRLAVSVTNTAPILPAWLLSNVQPSAATYETKRVPATGV